MQHIVFVETCSSSPHLETTFELAKLHLDRGDTVSYHFLGHCVPFNDFPKPREHFLFLRSSPAELGARLISNKNFCFTRGRRFQVECKLEIPEFNSLDDLRAYKYQTFRAGTACLSSLISKQKRSVPCVRVSRDLIKRMLISGISTYKYTLKILQDERPALIYVFNGRFINNRAILDAAICANVPFMVHERGANKNRYWALPFTPHNLKRFQETLLKEWRGNHSLANKTDLATNFFKNQRSAIEQSWIPLNAGQKKGQAADIKLNGKQIITYFSTSDDELASVADDIDLGPWGSQKNAFAALLEAVKQLPQYHLFVRLHPHLHIKHKDDLKQWLDVNLPENVTLILPNSSVDSYTLIEQSHVTVSFGSTIGIESVFWGTPSICLGPSAYSLLGATYEPKTFEQLKGLLTSDSLPVNPEAALPYGYFMATFGEPFTYYEAETLFKGKLLGVNIQEEHMVNQIKRMLQPWANRLRRLAQGV